MTTEIAGKKGGGRPVSDPLIFQMHVCNDAPAFPGKRVDLPDADGHLGLVAEDGFHQLAAEDGDP